jgi:hypothetical protein
MMNNSNDLLAIERRREKTIVLRELFEEYKKSSSGILSTNNTLDIISKKYTIHNDDDDDDEKLILEDYFKNDLEADESTFIIFYKFCFLVSSLRQKQEEEEVDVEHDDGEDKKRISISITRACALWSFLLSQKNGGKKSTSSTIGVLKRSILPSWFNRTFCKFCEEKVAFIDEETFNRTLDFAKTYRKMNGQINASNIMNDNWPRLIRDFISSRHFIGRETTTTTFTTTMMMTNGQEQEGEEEDENDNDDEKNINTIINVEQMRMQKGGRIGMKTVHPRGKKRANEAANVEVLSSQLTAALQTKKRKTGGIRLDFF